MTNYSLIENTIAMVEMWQEATWGIGNSLSRKPITKYVEDWYNNTDFTDPKLLAACVIKFTWYTPINYTTAMKVKEEIFG